MIFISLAKFRKPPEKEDAGDTAKMIADWKAQGINMLNWYWTLGSYDRVVVFEADSEKEAMKMAIGISQWVTSETLVAIPREEAIKLL
ncbi:MAG: GYD domain-containing protein [Candidatus Bathyarchaeota archaeon]|nr:GYD domain-containing protein [Candidatus Bathyarchaeota archaeon]